MFELGSPTATSQKSSSEVMEDGRLNEVLRHILKPRLFPAKDQQRQESKRGAFSPEKMRIGAIWGLLCRVTGVGFKETLMMLKGSYVLLHLIAVIL